ncbi:hypothetical protein TNCV_5115331 [Trichonephila clavipes]|nr:hypothetical protein TNCV_5115331 [Trichonephila clavipes]
MHDNTILCKYADDTTVLAKPYRTKTHCQSTKQNLLELESWFSRWKIALNVAKTEAVFLESPIGSPIGSPTPLEASTPGHDEGTPPGTEVNQSQSSLSPRGKGAITYIVVHELTAISSNQRSPIANASCTAIGSPLKSRPSSSPSFKTMKIRVPDRG